MQVINITDAQKQFAEIINLVQNGIEIMLIDNDKPAIKMVLVSDNIQESESPRILGLHQGQGWMSEDFDEPLPDEFWLGK